MTETATPMDRKVDPDDINALFNTVQRRVEAAGEKGHYQPEGVPFLTDTDHVRADLTKRHEDAQALVRARLETLWRDAPAGQKAQTILDGIASGQTPAIAEGRGPSGQQTIHLLQTRPPHIVSTRMINGRPHQTWSEPQPIPLDGLTVVCPEEDGVQNPDINVYLVDNNKFRNAGGGAPELHAFDPQRVETGMGELRIQGLYESSVLPLERVATTGYDPSETAA